MRHEVVHSQIVSDHFNMIMDGIYIRLVFVTFLQVFCSNMIVIYDFAYAAVRLRF